MIEYADGPPTPPKKLAKADGPLTKEDMIALAQAAQKTLHEKDLKARREGYYEAKDGSRYTRATTVAGCLDKPNLLDWAARSAIDYVHQLWSNGSLQEKDFQIGKTAWRTVSNKGKKFGTIVHKLIEKHIKTGLDIDGLPRGTPAEVQRAVAAFNEFEAEYIDYWLLSECKVWSDEMETAGTLDSMAVMKKPHAGAIYILDFKTSTGIFEDAYFQAGGYYLMWLEQIRAEIVPEQLHPDGALILRLDKKTAMPQWRDATEFLPQAAETFRRLAVMMQAKLEFDQVKPDWRDK